MITEKNNVIYLETQNTEYIFAVHPNGTLQNEYWGARIGVSGGFSGKTQDDRSSNDPVEDFYTEEYSAWGGARFPSAGISGSGHKRSLTRRYSTLRFISPSAM